MTRPDFRACHWTQDDDGNWATQCGELFILLEGGPHENRMRFCTYCGERVSAPDVFGAEQVTEPGTALQMAESGAPPEPAGPISANETSGIMPSLHMHELASMTVDGSEWDRAIEAARLNGRVEMALRLATASGDMLSDAWSHAINESHMRGADSDGELRTFIRELCTIVNRADGITTDEEPKP